MNGSERVWGLCLGQKPHAQNPDMQDLPDLDRQFPPKMQIKFACSLRVMVCLSAKVLSYVCLCLPATIAASDVSCLCLCLLLVCRLVLIMALLAAKQPSAGCPGRLIAQAQDLLSPVALAIQPRG